MRLVHRDLPEVAGLTAVDHLEVGIPAERGDVVRGDGLGEVDVAGLERIELGGLVGVRLEDDLVEVGDPFGVPVVGVLLDRHVIVRNPFLVFERTRADHAVALALGVRALARIGVVRVAGLERRRALDPELRQGGLGDEEVRLRDLELELDGRGVDGRDRCEVRVRGPAKDCPEVVVVGVAKRRRGILLTIVVVDDGFGVEVGAVVELDPGPELERIGQAVGARLGNALREHRLDLAQGPGLDAEQALDDVELDVRRVAVADQGRVGENHVAGQADDDRAALLDLGTGRWRRLSARGRPAGPRAAGRWRR